MNTQNIQHTIDSLQSFMGRTGNKLNKKEKAELIFIIDGLKSNLAKPDRAQIIQLALLIVRVMMQGTELIQHLK